MVKGKRWLTLTDGALELSMPYRACYDLALQGRLEARRIGVRWYVRASDVERLVRERRAAKRLVATR